jgi:hypothetical protein
VDPAIKRSTVSTILKIVFILTYPQDNHIWAFRTQNCLVHFKDRRMFRNYKTEFDFSEVSSSSSHNKACDAWGPPCHATMYSSSLLLNIPTLIIIHLLRLSRRWIAFTRQTILNDFRKCKFRWHFVYNYMYIERTVHIFFTLWWWSNSKHLYCMYTARGANFV